MCCQNTHPYTLCIFLETHTAACFPTGLSSGRSRFVTRQPCFYLSLNHPRGYYFTAPKWSLAQESEIVLQATMPLTSCRLNTGSWKLSDFRDRLLYYFCITKKRASMVWISWWGREWMKAVTSSCCSKMTKVPEGSGTAPDRSYNFLMDSVTILKWPI